MPMRGPVQEILERNQELLREMQETGRFAVVREPWPYSWAYPPPGVKPFFRRGHILAPGNGTQTQVLSYKVPEGFYAVLTDVMNLYIGSAFIEGSGAITWVYDVNRPIGATVATGYNVQDLGSVLTRLGSLDGPWPLRNMYIFKDGQTLRQKVTTIVPIPVGTPNMLHGAIQGWLWSYKTSVPGTARK